MMLHMSGVCCWLCSPLRWVLFLELRLSLLSLCRVPDGAPHPAIAPFRAIRRESVAVASCRSRCTLWVVRHLKMILHLFSYRSSYFVFCESPKQPVQVLQNGSLWSPRQVVGRSAMFGLIGLTLHFRQSVQLYSCLGMEPSHLCKDPLRSRVTKFVVIVLNQQLGCWVVRIQEYWKDGGGLFPQHGVVCLPRVLPVEGCCYCLS